MANVILAGLIWQILGLEIDLLSEIVLKKFAHKEQFVEINRKCVNHGYTLKLRNTFTLSLPKRDKSKVNEMIMTGNHALSLGAVSAGMRAFYAYPMTPSSSILSYLADTYKETGIVVKQVEDEITAAQMALGSMYMGTRAMTATSGGGFDLMTETFSLAGMIETPWVCVLAQRPGPATGLPTWTAAGDLNLAVYAAHGEFPRLVLSVSDAETSYTLTQQAFNLAERYQIPVIILTDKQVAESLFQIESLPEPLPIERGLLNDNDPDPSPNDRYKFTQTGVSDRWIPGQFKSTYNANSDEHNMDGSITEESEPSIASMEKRMRKLDTLKAELPEPILHPTTAPAKKVIIGWGSVKNSVLDAVKLLSTDDKADVSYLHFDYIYPLRTGLIKELEDKGTEFYLVENNYQGQLGQLITRETGIIIKDQNRLLKYDGRPFFTDEVYKFIESIV